ncbi:MAG: hypothetical protein AAB803_00485 [Patescibacteria group bacterium]
MLSIFSVFALWRIVDLLIAIMAPSLLVHNVPFRFAYIMERGLLPDFLTGFANFDGVHFLHIATSGYATYEQAFFPLYPLLVRMVTAFTHSPFLAGFLLSNAVFLASLAILLTYVKKITSSGAARWTLLFLLVFPTSFFFGSVYATSLFFFLVLCTFLFIDRKKYGLAGACAFLASLTWIGGIFLVIPLGLALWQDKKRFLASLRSLAILAAPFLGVGLYMAYLARTTGDPLFFYHAQPAFGANRSTGIILLPQILYRYIRIFTTAPRDIVYAVALFELITFTLVLSVLVYDLYKVWHAKAGLARTQRLGLSLFSFATLVLPTLTGTFSSLPRYALFSVAYFVRLAEMRSFLLKTIVLLLFILAHIAALVLFIQGYFVG